MNLIYMTRSFWYFLLPKMWISCRNVTEFLTFLRDSGCVEDACNLLLELWIVHCVQIKVVLLNKRTMAAGVTSFVLCGYLKFVLQIQWVISFLYTKKFFIKSTKCPLNLVNDLIFWSISFFIELFKWIN